MNYCTLIKQFTQNCQPIPSTPQLMTFEDVKFVKKMVTSELYELLDATSIHDQADALLDAIIYLCDAAVRKGINLDKLIGIVHHANMQKIVNGKVLVNEIGKVLKPEGWQDPEPLLIKAIELQEKGGSWT